jgi:hypothetical protein
MKHAFITYQSGPGDQIHVAHIQPKSWLVGYFSDFVFPDNFNDPRAYQDDTYSLVVDGEVIFANDFEEPPPLNLARRADVIVHGNAGDTCIYIKNGCEALFEKHFGRILEIKKYSSRDEYDREYSKKFMEVYYGA